MKEFSYDREAAVNYAKKWAFERNPAYYDFSNLGGDCTNFASQCIFAGSGVMNYTPTFGWFYISINQRTASWTGVEYLYDFLTSNQTAGPFGREVTEDEIEPGDILQLGHSNGDFYHTPVIIATRPTILLAAHSNDALNRPLYTYDYDIIRFIHIEGVRNW